MLQTLWPLESSGAFSDRTDLHQKKKKKDLPLFRF
jgi:hypothetical protein